MIYYNQVFNVNPIATDLMNILDLEPKHLGAFLDAYLHVEKDEMFIGVYTELGGLNRLHVRDNKSGVTCPCNACIIVHKVPKHKLYVKDYSNKFDMNFCTILFKIPLNLRKDLVEIYENTKEFHVKPEEKHAALLTAIRGICRELEEKCAVTGMPLLAVSESMKDQEKEHPNMVRMIDMAYWKMTNKK